MRGLSLVPGMLRRKESSFFVIAISLVNLYEPRDGTLLNRDMSRHGKGGRGRGRGTDLGVTHMLGNGVEKDVRCRSARREATGRIDSNTFS
jgi:hypothetical protein